MSGGAAPPPIGWEAQEGPQAALMNVPAGIEVFYGGARGGGKTDGIIGRWLLHEAKWGARARGLVFRTEFTQLRDFRRRCVEVFGTVTPARWASAENSFVFASGATLTLAHARTEDDAAKYQGWSVNFLGFEEIGEWPSPGPIWRLYGILRDATGVGLVWLATGNPGGAGHAWVREEFVEGKHPYTLYAVRGPDGKPLLNAKGKTKRRVFIPAKVTDNPKLLENDPDYLVNLRRQAGHLARAWEHGDWDVAPGAYLEDVYDSAVHVIDDFQPPPWWPRFIALDWGFRAPYSVGWYTVRPDDGALIRYRELYGYGGKPNVGARRTVGEVAALIKRANEDHERPDAAWKRNVADASMWAEAGRQRGASLATEFAEHGVRFHPGPSERRSRVATLGILVSRLRDRRFFVTRSCRHWIRTVPVITPDPDYPEDVDTDAEDHAIDETRYACWLWENYGARAVDTRRRITGPKPAPHGTLRTPGTPGEWLDGRPPAETEPVTAATLFGTE